MNQSLLDRRSTCWISDPFRASNFPVGSAPQGYALGYDSRPRWGHQLKRRNLSHLLTPTLSSATGARELQRLCGPLSPLGRGLGQGGS